MRYIFLITVMLAIACGASAQNPAPLSSPVTRSLRDGERHEYELALENGQLLRVELEQQGIDVLLTLQDPGGVAVYQADNPNTAQENELLLYVAPQTGRYRLVVTPRRKGEEGRYVLRLEDLHTASEHDRVLAQAEQLYAQGQFVRADGAGPNLRAARAFFEQSLALWQSAGDPAGEAKTLHRLAYVERQLGAPECPEHARQALATARAAGARATMSRALYLHGLLASGELKFALAADYYSQAIASDESAGGSRTPYSFVSRAYALQQLGEHQKAREDYLRGLAVLQKYPDRYAQAYTHHIYALFLYDVYNDYAGALAEFDKALTLRRLAEDARGEGRTLNLQAQVYRLMKQPERARAALLQGYQISVQTGDTIAQNDALTELGKLAAETGDNEAARNYYQRAIALLDKKDDGSAAPDGHLSLGLVYVRLGQETAARAEYEKALRYYRRTKQPSGEAQALYYLGLLENEANRLPQARSYIEQSLALEENAEARYKNERLHTVFAAHQ
jgi:tetratricopeptide (TPR) repeat protein